MLPTTIQEFIEGKVGEFDCKFGTPIDETDPSLGSKPGESAGCDDCAKNMEIRQEHKDHLRFSLRKLVELQKERVLEIVRDLQGQNTYEENEALVYKTTLSEVEKAISKKL